MVDNMTNLMEEKRELTRGHIPFKNPTRHPLMTRGVPILGGNPKGPGIVKNNIIIKTKHKSLAKAYG